MMLLYSIKVNKKYSSSKMLNSHETILYYAGAMTYIIRAFNVNHEGALENFKKLRDYMTDEMADRLFEIYSFFDFMKRKDLDGRMPVIVAHGQTYRKPDLRFLISCNLLWMYYSTQDVFPNKADKFEEADESYAVDKVEDIKPVIPFKELNQQERMRLRASPADSTIRELWILYRLQFSELLALQPRPYKFNKLSDGTDRLLSDYNEMNDPIAYEMIRDGDFSSLVPSFEAFTMKHAIKNLQIMSSPFMKLKAKLQQDEVSPAEIKRLLEEAKRKEELRQTAVLKW
jgi:hypothetical protein